MALALLPDRADIDAVSGAIELPNRKKLAMW
jgi:hypothetical protein